MASIVSSLKRGLSMSRDSQQTTPRGQGSIPNSPSFSDFSLGAEMEAEHELWRSKSRKTIDPAASSPAPGNPTWSSMFASSPARDIPQAQEASNSQIASPTLTTAQSVPRRRPEGKIGGMSYYDYHDLIRSSSL